MLSQQVKRIIREKRGRRPKFVVRRHESFAQALLRFTKEEKINLVPVINPQFKKETFPLTFLTSKEEQ